MEYKVSEKIQKKFDTLTKDAKVQKALQFMEDDQNEIIDRQIELRRKDLQTAISTSTATASESEKVPAAERRFL